LIFFAILVIFGKQLTFLTDAMNIISSDQTNPMTAMLEAYDCPAILVSTEYQILATNSLYGEAFGAIDLHKTPRCFEISHGYKVPCDQAGEDCPLGAATKSGHRERVLHIHQTPNGKEHVDVELLPITDEKGHVAYFVELLRPVPLASGNIAGQLLVGQSQSFKAMLARISRVASTDAATLLLGESGTGKELAAKAIHMASNRNDKALVTLECAGLTDSLFESELFGHVKGAFTGAHSNKKGLVELADGGTLFLDEVGDIPLSMQVKLLRLLETGTYRPVGSADVRRSDFRLICATHRNLSQMTTAGTFRTDLYYRVNVFPITVPSLADRVSDIPLLAQTLLDRLGEKKKYKLTKKACDLLTRHHYRGNIRELRNLLNRAIVMTDTASIDDNVMQLCFDDEPIKPESSDTHWVDLKTIQNDYIKRLFAAHDGDKEKIAGILGISMRSLYRKLDEIGS